MNGKAVLIGAVFFIVLAISGYTRNPLVTAFGMAVCIGLLVHLFDRLKRLTLVQSEQRQQLEALQRQFESAREQTAQQAVAERVETEFSTTPQDPVVEPEIPSFAPEPVMPESDEAVSAEETEIPALAACQSVSPSSLAIEPVPAPVAASVTAHEHKPDLVMRLLGKAKTWLLEGNTVLKVGVVLLFLGLAFLLRYTSEKLGLTVEVNYLVVAVSALVLLGLGWWLRQRNTAYALMLQGAGIAVLYLTTFSALHLHGLISSGMAFVLLVLLTCGAVMLAILQDSLALAVAAILGGFAAPIVASTGAGNHVALFSYFVLLNAGIFAIAWFKAWRILNLVGFISTFGIGFAWGMRSYRPELLYSTEPFLIVFFLMYVGIGLLFARRKLLELAEQPPVERSQMLSWSLGRSDYVDGSLLFGPPLVGFGLQLALVNHIEFASAYSALVLGLFYLSLALLLRRCAGERIALLMETYLALGVIFASLAIPLGLDARWTSAAWAVEGAGLYWLGMRQNRPLARVFALLLQVGAAVAFMYTVTPHYGGIPSLLDGSPLGSLMVAAAFLFSCWQVYKAPLTIRRNWEQALLSILCCIGLFFLYLAAPLLFSTTGTVMAWALMGMASVVIGLYVRLSAGARFGVVLQAVAGASFILHAALIGQPDLFFLWDIVAFLMPGAALMLAGYVGSQMLFWMGVTLSISAMVSAYCLKQQAAQDDISGGWLLVSRVAIGLAILYWSIAGFHQIGLQFSAPVQLAAMLGFVALSVLFVQGLARGLVWHDLAQTCALLMPAATLLLVYAWFPAYHPAAHFGWLGWLLVFGVHAFSLWRLAGMLRGALCTAAHVWGCLLLIAVLSLELRYLLMQLSESYNAWRWLGWAVLPGVYLWLMASPRKGFWPLSAYPQAYRVWAALPLAVLMLAWFWIANAFSAGDAQPLPYIILINPLEIGLLLTLAGIYAWLQSEPVEQYLPAGYLQGKNVIVALSLFAFITVMVMRLAHHWGGVPWEMQALLRSMLVQVGWSLVWTLAALAAMLFGHLRGRRELWLVGAALIGLVVIKLFFIELGDKGSVERIISFIGVGVLLLVIGYFAPLPPRQKEQLESES